MEKLFQILLYHALPAVILIYVGLGALLWWFQRDYIFYPSEQQFSDCPAFNDAQQIEHNGTRAYYKDNGGPVVVYYHGNAGRACDRHFLAKEIESVHGYSYLFVEYSGYAEDDKEASSVALRADAKHMADFIASKEHSATVLMSESIGSGAVAEHARQRTPDALILFAPMYSLNDVARIHYPIYPVSLLLREKLPVATLLAQLDVPVHIIHGEDDRIIPISQSKKLFDELQATNKTYTVVARVGHNDLYGDSAILEAMHTALRSIQK